MNAPAGVERDYRSRGSRRSALAALRTSSHGPIARRVGGLLAWADADGLEVGMVGSGSNLLVADAGFRGLVMKPTRWRDRAGGDRPLCGGGARLPHAAAPRRPRRPHGPRVRRQHPGDRRRRGQDERERLRRRPRAGARVGRGRLLSGTDIAHPRRARLPLPAHQPGPARDRVARVVRAHAGRARGCEGHPRRDAVGAARRSPRHQDLRLHLQEPRRSARRGQERKKSLLRRGRPSGSRCRRRPLLEKHANFVENGGAGHNRRRHRPDGGGGGAGCGSASCVEPEPEVQFLGDAGASALWGAR